MPNRAERRAGAANARKFLKKVGDTQHLTTIVHGHVEEDEIEPIRLAYGGVSVVMDWPGDTLTPQAVHFCHLPPKESLVELQQKHHLSLRIVAADVAREMVKIDRESRNGS